MFNEMWFNNAWYSSKHIIEESKVKFSIEDQELLKKYLEENDKDFEIPDEIKKKLFLVQKKIETDTDISIIDKIPIINVDLELYKSLFLNLMNCIGTPAIQESNRDIITSVINTDSDGQDGRLSLTNLKLSWHSDATDVVALFCIEQAKIGGTTSLVNSKLVHNEILKKNPALLKVLYDDFYFAYRKYHDKNTTYTKMPIFSYQNGTFVGYTFGSLIDFAQNHCDVPKLTSLQKEALELLDETCDKFAVEIFLEPGQILLLNSYTTFHGRNAYVDKSENQKRHLLRIGLSVPNSRELPESFRDKFGEIAAGQIRGGFRYLDKN